MAVPAQLVKDLRDQTGAGMLDCKRALEQAGGDIEKARILLREKGLADAARRSGRRTREGFIAHYSHADGRIAVLVELACESDFVARTDVFRSLGKELAMQVAAMAPLAVSPESLPEQVLKAERELYLQQCADKPEQVRERIVEGKLQKFYEQTCLMYQPYIRDPARKVQDLVNETIAKLGENIQVRRFVRMEVGESF